jgi:hypothetical protein
MDKNKVSVIISAEDRAGAVLKTIGGYLAATFSAAAVAAFGKAAVDAASEQEQAEVKLVQALGHTSSALTDQAAALQRTTKFGDESIVNAQAMLAMYTKDEQQIKALTRATLDFAQAKNMDLASAADLVGKSLGSETNALTRYGIEVQGAVGGTERFAGMMHGLSSHFGGQAEAAANTYSGTVAKLGNAFSDVMEEIGAIIVKNPVFLKALDLATGAFEQLSGWVKNNQQFLMELVAGGVASFVRAMGMAVQVVNVFRTLWTGLETAVNAVVYAMVSGLELLITPFAFVTARLKEYGLIQNDYLAGVKDGISEYRQFVGETIRKTSGDFVDSFRNYGETWTFWNGLADRLTNIEVKATQAGDAIATVKPPDAELPLGQFLGPTEEAQVYAATLEEVYWRIGLASTESMLRQVANNEILQRSDQVAANVRNAAYNAMQAQLLRMVELHRFSAAEFGKAVLQQVKMELVGLAARATVWALFETAMGLATMFTNPAASASHFAAAGQFAAVAGATLAAAAAVNAVVGPGAQPAVAGASPSNPVYTSSGGGSGAPEPPRLGQSGIEGGGTVIVHLNVTAPLGKEYTQEDWERIAELYIQPAFSRNGERGVQISAAAVSPA